MKPFAKVYAVAMSAVGLFVGLYSIYVIIADFSRSQDLSRELVQLVILFLLAYFCRCFPIYIRPDFSIDMAFISNFAILLFKGPYYAAAITLIGSIFVVVPTPGPEKKLMHILNTPLLKTLFNNANFTLSVFFGGLVFIRAGGIVGDLSFPGILLPSLAMIITIITSNSVILIYLFKLNIGIPFFSSCLKNLVNFFPSVLASAPIGYFIAKFMTMESGEYLVILFLLPMMLARFSFTLYIDTKQNYYVMLKTLTYTIEAKDDYTRGHSERVEHYAKILARAMRMSPAQIDEISVAALLHDVGKIGIDESILRKPARLTPEERFAIEKHPELSVNILKEVKLSSLVFEIILHHHERYEGGGYPAGITGEKLPIEVFILSVSDTYDAITSSRPYSPAKTPEQAKEIIISERGRQFHPKVVDAFVKAFDKGALEPLPQEYEKPAFFM